VVLIYHVNKLGTSYNLSFYRGVSPVWHAERLVLFTKYENDNPTAAATYVHEILHGFGAGELYFPFDSSERRKDAAKQIFPNDVMLRVDYDITTLDIGEYTAYRIGWIEELDDRFCIFEDYE